MNKDLMQYASGYQLDLYCDNPLGVGTARHYSAATFTGETFRECAATARKSGWTIFQKTRTARCRKCRNELEAAKKAKR